MLDTSRPAVAEFIARFEAGRVARAEWTHLAHLVAGYWYVREQGAEQALEEMRARIRHHNDCVGTPNTDDSGYHETLTRLYLDAIAAHLVAHDGATFEAGLDALLASPLARSDWPLRRYSRERLFSVAARKGWVAPDLD